MAIFSTNPGFASRGGSLPGMGHGNLLTAAVGMLLGLLLGGLLQRLMSGGQFGSPFPGGNPGFGSATPVGGGGGGSPAQAMGSNLNNFLGGPSGAPQANPNAQIPSFGPNANKQQIGQMLDAAAAKYGIPPNILKAVAWQESNWRPDARSFDGGHGKGVMQIDDRYHDFARSNEVFDPAKNIDYGARYLRQLYDETGSWEAALKRYNGGSSYPPKIMAHAQSQPWAA